MILTLTRILAAVVLLLPVASCAEEDPPLSSEAKDPPPPSSTEEEPPLAYVSLGDSLAVGVGASDPEELGYTPLYHGLLEEASDREVPLVGLGVSGETSESFMDGPDPQLARAESVLADNPGAIVTLSLGANDLLAAGGDTDADREEVLARYSRNLDRILRSLADASDPAPHIMVLALYNPAPGSFTDEWGGRLNAQIRAVAQVNGASVAAGDRAFEGREAEYAHYYASNPYDIHPTDKGYEMLARAFAEATT